jgi:hypothetical protein
MASVSFEELQQDNLAMSVARALALANEAAVTRGTDPSASLISISEESSANGRLWRINYGPRNCVSRRGGDLIVIVDDRAQSVQKVIRGQ